MKAMHSHIQITATAFPAPGDLLDEKETAAILGTAVATLRNWRALGKGPAFRKIGERLVRYHRADLAAFIGESAA